jgi:hypothetical protein
VPLVRQVLLGGALTDGRVVARLAAAGEARLLPRVRLFLGSGDGTSGGSGVPEEPRKLNFLAGYDVEVRARVCWAGGAGAWGSGGICGFMPLCLCSP